MPAAGWNRVTPVAPDQYLETSSPGIPAKDRECPLRFNHQPTGCGKGRKQSRAVPSSANGVSPQPHRTVIRYLAATPRISILFSSQPAAPLDHSVFGDAAFADQPGHLSSIGYLVKLNDAPISWKATRLHAVVTSTTGRDSCDGGCGERRVILAEIPGQTR